jgi:AhpD family alkylhydroperoxidase
MTPRLDPAAVAAAALQPMRAFEAAIATWFSADLIHLVKLRASQINGCAYCVHMHSREARADGETEERLYLTATWWESPLFTPRERAALAWTDALTRLSQAQPDEAIRDQLAAAFTEEEQVKLTLLIGAINTWNRLAVGFHMVHPVAAPGVGSVHA